MKVIDSSSLVKYFSKEEGWKLVKKAILDGVVTLDLAVKEVANALWKKVLRSEISIDDANKIITDLLEAEVIKVISQDKYLTQAFKIAVENKITVYDALFIALAKEMNIELITSDAKQAEVAKEEGVSVRII
ncbi:MAG: PIN domain nuclease [Thermoprotei archaeon]|nr:MAG: PIN domain nuclease [Thermofilum sp. ex4484_79]RLF07178.1 MAG: PIN domain nuclease [Thermoprotei archaeon]